MDENYLRLNDQGLVEVNPMASYNARQEFIDNYRATQAERTEQLGESAHALGSDLPARLGGLHGPSEYWKSRYQTPQTDATIANLRATNQLQALNALMQNDLSKWADRYSQAQRQASQTSSSTPSSDGEKLEISTIANESEVPVSLNPNEGVAGKVQYDSASGETFVTDDTGSKTKLYNLTDLAEMRAEGWKLTGKFPNGREMTDGTVYRDPQTGIIYGVYDGRLYQLAEAVPNTGGGGSW